LTTPGRQRQNRADYTCRDDDPSNSTKGWPFDAPFTHSRPFVNLGTDHLAMARSIREKGSNTDAFIKKIVT
jgi:hypothetical protein